MTNDLHSALENAESAATDMLKSILFASAAVGKVSQHLAEREHEVGVAKARIMAQIDLCRTDDKVTWRADPSLAWDAMKEIERIVRAEF